MRPFFVYGQPHLRQYLKDQGFDVFEDIFDYSIIDEASGDVGKQMQYAQVAINAINNISDPIEDYRKHFYRLQCNKARFREYAYEQWYKLHILDLKNYV